MAAVCHAARRVRYPSAVHASATCRAPAPPTRVRYPSGPRASPGPRRPENARTHPCPVRPSRDPGRPACANKAPPRAALIVSPPRARPQSARAAPQRAQGATLDGDEARPRPACDGDGAGARLTATAESHGGQTTAALDRDGGGRARIAAGRLVCGQPARGRLTASESPVRARTHRRGGDSLATSGPRTPRGGPHTRLAPAVEGGRACPHLLLGPPRAASLADIRVHRLPRRYPSPLPPSSSPVRSLPSARCLG